MNIFKNISLAEIKKIPLFSEYEDNELSSLLRHSGFEIGTYRKKERLIAEQREEPLFGIVLGGKIFAVHESSEGQNSLLHTVFPGELFEITAFPRQQGDNFWLAAEPSRVLLIKGEHLYALCKRSPFMGKKLIYDLMLELADANRKMLEKFCHISRHTLRRKILSFLAEQYREADSNTFEVRLNRQELADYLGADRSALSAELAKMKKAGMIDYRRNEFTVLDKAAFAYI